MIELLGCTVSKKADGDLISTLDEDVEILGLIYKRTQKSILVKADRHRVTKIIEATDTVADKIKDSAQVPKIFLQRALGLINFPSSHKQYRFEGPLRAMLAKSLSSEDDFIRIKERPLMLACLKELREQLDLDYDYCFDLSENTLLRSSPSTPVSVHHSTQHHPHHQIALTPIQTVLAQLTAVQPHRQRPARYFKVPRLRQQKKPPGSRRKVLTAYHYSISLQLLRKPGAFFSGRTNGKRRCLNRQTLQGACTTSYA